MYENEKLKEQKVHESEKFRTCFLHENEKSATLGIITQRASTYPFNIIFIHLNLSM